MRRTPRTRRVNGRARTAVARTARQQAARRRARRPAPAPTAPSFTALDRDACDAVLARNTVGRLGFSFRDRVDIEPIHYVYADGWIYGRTRPSSKLLTLRRNPWVVLEVDEADGMFDWRSVVVRGTLYQLDPARSAREAAAWTQTVAALRRLLPETLTRDDPVPFRTVLFRIHVDHVSGRAASSAAGGAP